MSRLVGALLAEVDRRLDGRDADAPVATIFVGGGTPTVLPAALLERLLGRLGAIARQDQAVEFTVEANPATVDAGVAALLRAHGVTRLSIGVQSFDPVVLEVLDRAHAPSDAEATVAVAREAGFAHVNVDLIFAVPGQTMASWRQTLERTLALAIDHVSCYSLTFEPGTPLYARWQRGAVAPVDDELAVAMYETAIDTLAAHGFEQYEISNFARPGARCRHNEATWRNESYVGVGPSAASFVGGVRERNVTDIDAYVAAIERHGSAVVERECLDPLARLGETAILRLRTIEGIDRQAFARCFGLDPGAAFRSAVQTHAAAGRLVVTDAHIRLSRAGLPVADSVMVDFLVPDVGRLPGETQDLTPTRAGSSRLRA
jgi:oxygen-independent coproporphyrinogen-3 oxidase